ncbi:ribosomal protein S18 acetylase RimI-like enzyme [Nocardiopsis sp. Huas11]|uniref:GNAT family N-acetyltransferase n=1 Tax=Nocardiopsis sp. Huas11 TaxID=2183912 RepID=UPI000EB31A0A|nr:GNAT family N-acetyltransferase [Nocardiopsis sp. Huas11]RKS06388.1 ribosomal protein S18 acetylase RimI-like enzyme [Nocardiopsis sp. Huas11]
MPDVRIRTARPSDHARFVAVCDEWWGRPMTHLLPRLFLDHFHTTSLTAEEGEELAGFLVGFVSPSDPEEAYVHFIAVAPEHRRSGLAGELYRRFADAARERGCAVVRAITSPANERSIAFHGAFGFTVTGPHPDYDGPGVDRMAFELRL